MRIISLTGKNIEEEKKTITRELESENPVVFVLAEEAESVHRYIEKLELDGGLLFKLKVCKDFKVDVNIGKENFRSIKAILNSIEPNAPYQIVINDNRHSTLANVYQQLIYIDFPVKNVDILLKGEVETFAKMKYLREHIGEIEIAVKDLQKAFDGSINTLTDTLTEKRACFKTSTNTIAEAIAQVSSGDITLNIAVAASKKTGKSVIINSMLGQEIASTSLELPTPNACVYYSDDKDTYRIVFGEIKKEFSSSKEIHSYIDEQFKKARDEENASIKDMYISYPKGANKQGFENYVLHDTPGPDFAVAGAPDKNAHAECAKEHIKNSDVVIFAINYSKYLTTSEVAFLRDVKSLFEDRKKFYSLVFVVNRIDERYGSANDKSVLRILDLIRDNLIKLGYTDCIVMGTSAQQYFTAHIAPTIGNLSDLSTLKSCQDIQNRIKEGKGQTKDVVLKTYLSVLNESFDRLCCNDYQNMI